MTTNTTQKAAGATNTNGPHTDTNGSDSRALNAAEQAADGKALATHIAGLALAGYAVHQLKDGGFLVCRQGCTYHVIDRDSLNLLTRRLKGGAL